MPESTHDLIAAKAARLRELLRRTEPDPVDADDDGTIPERSDADETVGGPSWSGGGWNN